ncbi:SGNH/GDSL hydrolase family protein [Alphaproteobacteria bacterium KMM 3653]|uniref:SGNH/GDSL hydrolase family protein n=1 Tax=Harenicola maris TaxID=2841044 RepID=A0AAP2CU47_9RHOB|nr:SGNH/GDSL hydrolase family protein [Harenicola maris]
MRLFLFLLSLGVLWGCAEPVTRADTNGGEGQARILTMGDSLLASHGISGRAVSDVLEAQLGEPVIDRSVLGARVIYKLPISGSAGLNIGQQFRPGDWDWIVLNGGGNDLWLGCGCSRCERKVEKLISEDGKSGAIPQMLARLRGTGAKVVYVGYLRSPGVPSPIDSCREVGDLLEGRIAAAAQADAGLYFVSLADLVPEGDRSFHGLDMIHPSAKASAAIAGRIARVIR